MKYLAHFFIVYYVFTSVGFANEKFQLNRGVVSIWVAKDWQSVKDLFGVPLTFLGPKANGARPVVSFTPTGLQDLKFDQKSLEKNQDEYKTGREAWLQSKDGKSLQYYPYQFEHLKEGIDVHKIGYAYEINEIRYSEYSYYILCGGQLFHSKVLFRQDHEKQYKNVVEKMIRSFECK